ncbi:MAG: hypothetical protein AMJ69_01420 [Gammaproteobacteria bacterium SG8_47]|nr:MAG: hypothetical protein AMJ69_01420 [Gammaproteobacteria bacterium SG8_47]
MKHPALLFVLATGVTMASSGLADTMRCGNKLVRSGDASSTVVLICGEPTFKEVSSLEKDKVEDTQAAGATSSSVEVRVEKWTYNQGAGRLLKILTFRDSVLVSIDTGARM